MRPMSLGKPPRRIQHCDISRSRHSEKAANSVPDQDAPARLAPVPSLSRHVRREAVAADGPLRSRHPGPPGVGAPAEAAREGVDPRKVPFAKLVALGEDLERLRRRRTRRPSERVVGAEALVMMVTAHADAAAQTGHSAPRSRHSGRDGPARQDAKRGRAGVGCAGARPGSASDPDSDGGRGR
ncbi:hypothetical protein XA68_16462 [Ophiocordyceps unilateralis]|uniref:Uncharacterized protein n=1 Tax=Ophiocordyceps unilateralis TaxID=268505 RepID=A0A2A9P6K9_OPHUN|nr:hypothetical protein XA68_16462 [Ophiocordyceps unilateralis]